MLYFGEASPLPGHQKPIRFPGRFVSVDVVDSVQVNLSSLSHTSMDFLAGLWSSFQALKTSQRMVVERLTEQERVARVKALTKQQESTKQQDSAKQLIYE